VLLPQTQRRARTLVSSGGAFPFWAAVPPCSQTPPWTCGRAAADPDIRAAFARFEQNQSAAAAKACAYFSKDALGVLW